MSNDSQLPSQLAALNSPAPSTVAPPPRDAASTHAWLSAPAETTQGLGDGVTGRDAESSSTVKVDVPGYEIRGELGRGGMGLVLQGHDPQFGRDVAVKVLLERHRDRPELTHRFLKEARINGQMQHPGVVPVYAMGEFADQRPYFTMKLVEGRTLAELLGERSEPAQDRARFVKIFEQVCQTLAYAHARRVIHRDLKPQNIMVGAFGEVQVMDWGLGKVLGESDAPLVGGTAPSNIDSDFATQAGVGLGTLAYMPPEQARGEQDRIDTRSDVFGLGAILCEILTGAPPYATSDTASRYDQALHARLADAFARLDVCGADAELTAIAKHCLATQPDDRPRDAGVLAAEVTAYLESVEARLRQAELQRAAAEVRACEERKRRKLTLSLATAVVVVGVLIGGGMLWLQAQGSDTERNVNLALGKAEQLHAHAERMPLATSQQATAALAVWNQSQAAVEQAEGVLETGIPNDALRSQVAAARAEVDSALARATQERDQLLREEKLLADLDAARMKRMLWVRTGDQSPSPDVGPAFEPDRTLLPTGGNFDFVGSVEAYYQTLSEFGLRLSPEQGLPSADAIRAQRPAVREALIVALDDCAISAIRGDWGGPLTWHHILKIAHAADDNEQRQAFRQALSDANVEQVKLAANQALDAGLASSSVVLIADGLDLLHEHAAAVDLLRRARGRYPADFWLQFRLGTLLDVRDLSPAAVEEKLGCYWAALAIRPDSVAAYNNLESALAYKQDRDGALSAFRAAAAINTSDPWVQSNLGCALYDLRDFPGAGAAFAEAIRLKPDLAAAHANLGFVRFAQNDVDGAAASFTRAVEHDPKYALAHCNLGIALATKNEIPAALESFEKAVELNPGYVSAHFNIGVARLRQGDNTRAEPALRRAIELNPRFAVAHYHLGLVHAQRGDFESAVASFQRTAELDGTIADAHAMLGRALLLLGRYDEAQKSLRHCLNMGAPDNAALQAATANLKRCERLIALEEKLPAVLDGTARPTDVAETLDFTEICRCRQKFAAAARLMGQALAADEQLAADLTGGARFDAACFAARAAAGEGSDAAELDDAERATLRRQALDWLRADLDMWTKQLETSTDDDRKLAEQTLKHWQSDPDLAGIRDEKQLEKFPAEEQAACQRLWIDVKDLLERASSPTQ